MRQVFTSPRLENVEAVAKMLEDAGIATKVTNPRSYKGRFRRTASYRGSNEDAQSSVWVVHSEDQPQARAILREQGLLASTRPEEQREGSFAQMQFRQADEAALRPRLRPGQLKMLLLLLIAGGFGLVMWTKNRLPAKPAATPVANASVPGAHVAKTVPMVQTRTALPDAYEAETPTALAAMLAAREAKSRGWKTACVEVDGQPANARVREQLPRELRLPATCETGMPKIVIGGYMTDGSGQGELRVETMAGEDKHSRTLKVRRQDTRWDVL